MAKIKHVIELNNIGTIEFTSEYQFAQTKGIKVDISRKGVRISAALSKAYTVEEMIGYGGYYLFPDALKKAMLLYVMYYSSPLNIKSVKITIGNNEHNVPVKNTPILYSMITDEMDYPLSEAWRNETIIKELLSFTKSKKDRRIASLYAFLYAKTRIYEIEKFIYYWMAFNGFYGVIGDKIGSMLTERNRLSGKNKKVEVKDTYALAYCLAYYGHAKHKVSKNDTNRIANGVIRLMKDWDGSPITEESLQDGVHRELRDQIDELLYRQEEDKEAEALRNDGKKVMKKSTKIEVTAYGYLLGFFAYYFRCNILHASKPLPLFSYISEYELTCLRAINQMMEQFIEKHLPELIMESKTEQFDDKLKGLLDDHSINMNF